MFSSSFLIKPGQLHTSVIKSVLFIRSLLLSLLAVSRSILLFVLSPTFSLAFLFFYCLWWCLCPSFSPPYLSCCISQQLTGKSECMTPDNHSAAVPASFLYFLLPVCLSCPDVKKSYLKLFKFGPCSPFDVSLLFFLGQ